MLVGALCSVCARSRLPPSLPLCGPSGCGLPCLSLVGLLPSGFVPSLLAVFALPRCRACPLPARRPVCAPLAACAGPVGSCSPSGFKGAQGRAPMLIKAANEATQKPAHYTSQNYPHNKPTSFLLDMGLLPMPAIISLFSRILSDHAPTSGPSMRLPLRI